MRAGDLDRLVQVRRFSLTDDGFGHTETWTDFGRPQFAAKDDVRDTEKLAAGQVMATLMSRFTLRWSAENATITAKDRLVCEGREYSIAGVKEGPGRREWIELTVTSRSDA